MDTWNYPSLRRYGAYVVVIDNTASGQNGLTERADPREIDSAGIFRSDEMPQFFTRDFEGVTRRGGRVEARIRCETTVLESSSLAN